MTWTQDVPTSWTLCTALNPLHPFWREDLANVQKWLIRSGTTSVQRKDQDSPAWKRQNWQEIWQQFHVGDTESYKQLFTASSHTTPRCHQTKPEVTGTNYVSMTEYWGWQRMTSVSDQIPTSHTTDTELSLLAWNHNLQKAGKLLLYVLFSL